MTNRADTVSPAVADTTEWRALHEAAGLADLSAMGRLHIAGADALDLLNRLTTNKLEALPPGTARDTVITNGNGRIVDFLSLEALPDGPLPSLPPRGEGTGRLLCLTSPGRAQAVVDWLDTYTFGEDIAVMDVSGSTVQLALAGPAAPRLLAAVGIPGIPAERDRVVVAKIAGAEAVVWHALPGGADGFYLVTGIVHADALRRALLDAGAAPISPATWEACRIANGFPVYGAEFDDSVNPLEVRLRGAISEDKGCYTGQEVIARLLTYRKVQRRLMAVELTGPAQPGAEFIADARHPGVLTSVAALPDGRCVGLALVPMQLAEAGRALELAGTGVQAALHEPAYALATEPAES